jgi:hypothetical protein
MISRNFPAFANTQALAFDADVKSKITKIL